MTTTLCDVHVGKLRNVDDRYGRTYENLKTWIESEGNVYIGRKGVVFINGVRFPQKESFWANPFKPVNDSEEERDICLGKYYDYIRGRIIDENLYDELLSLKGKNLGCWCHPKKCHGEVLIWLIEKYEKYRRV